MEQKNTKIIVKYFAYCLEGLTFALFLSEHCYVNNINFLNKFLFYNLGFLVLPPGWFWEAIFLCRLEK